MYRRKNPNQLSLEEFCMPFGGKLNADSRWVKLAKLIPCDSIEDEYAEHFNGRGNEAFSVRIALGACLIKEKCKYTDEETVMQIQENPYLQYFLEFQTFQEIPPFDASTMVHFRKRINLKSLETITLKLMESDKAGTNVEEAGDSNDDSGYDCTKPESTVEGKKPDTEEAKDSKDGDDHDGTPPTSSGQDEEPPKETSANEGKPILDATCAPADIHYPTDLHLLNQSREWLERIIDKLYLLVAGNYKEKPRTYRQRAKKDYLKIEKQRKKSKNAVRKALRKQLDYMLRDLVIIEELVESNKASLEELSKTENDRLGVIQEVFWQQLTMYREKTHRVEDRIVSLSQPHIRPIVRGKAGAPVEFGAKVAISVVRGYVFIEKLSFDAFNEGITLQESIERYKARVGCYPKAVLADTLYRNRENIAYCKERGIRLSGPALGRPKADNNKEAKKIIKQDAGERSIVESKFGIGKRKFGLGRIMAHLSQTSQAVIAVQFLVMNLERKLRFLFTFLLQLLKDIRNSHILEIYAE